MKNSALGILFLGAIFMGCSKDCEPENSVCSEAPPSDEVCQAYFNRWFYDSESNSCEQIAYSGCEAYGFETKEACEECECD